jgi:uncharacterized coiled-coil protein SlyX
MKKLFSLAIVILMTISLVACTQPSDTTRIEELEATISEKEALIDNLLLLLEDKEVALSDLQDTITALQAEIDALRAELYDGTIIFTVAINGEQLTQVVHYNEEDAHTLLDLLMQGFDVEFDDFGWGKFVTRIEGLTTKYGNFISISKNGEASMVGIEDLTYEDQDVIHFELIWWDTTALSIHEAIEGFLDNYIDSYLYDSLHYYVLPGLYHLGIIDIYDQTIPETLVEETANDYVKSILIYQSLGLDVTDLTEELFDLKSVSHPYPTALQIIALSANDSLDLDAFKANFITDLNGRELAELDLDTLSLVLLALSLIEDTETLENDIISIIEQLLYMSAYGDNAASFAHVIMALVSHDIDPKDSAFNDSEGVSLIENFLKFHSGTGSFYYKMDDLEADLYFSTPQAFLALVVYEQYLNTFDEVHPFIFE